MTSRELVHRTLEFKNPERVPRQLWVLPWANLHCKEGVEGIERDFPMDFGGVDGGEREKPPTQGDPYAVGTHVDAWGAKFHNVQLVSATPDEVRQAVHGVFDTLWAEGGCIAQCEFGAGGKTENVRAVYEAWDEVLRPDRLK